MQSEEMRKTGECRSARLGRWFFPSSVVAKYSSHLPCSIDEWRSFSMRRFDFDGKHLIFHSTNPEFDDIIVDDPEAESAQIIGKVDWAYIKVD